MVLSTTVCKCTLRVRSCLEVIKVGEKELTIDLHELYRFLKAIYDGVDSIDGIVKKGFSRTTVTKYASIAQYINLIAVKRVKDERTGRRRKKFELTKKGLDFLILYERLLSLLK